MNEKTIDTNDPEITAETHVVYHYKGHKYQNLADAMSYAKLDRAKPEPDASPKE